MMSLSYSVRHRELVLASPSAMPRYSPFSMVARSIVQWWRVRAQYGMARLVHRDGVALRSMYSTPRASFNAWP
jgi:hypothetical protein